MLKLRRTSGLKPNNGFYKGAVYPHKNLRPELQTKWLRREQFHAFVQVPG